mgnify:CR=1 FL=1
MRAYYHFLTKKPRKQMQLSLYSISFHTYLLFFVCCVYLKHWALIIISVLCLETLCLLLASLLNILFVLYIYSMFLFDL